MKYAWIADQRGRLPIGRLCALLEVSRSGFHAWQRRGASKRSRADTRLAVELRARFARHRGKYGRLSLSP